MLPASATVRVRQPLRCDISTDDTRINDRIRAREVLLIGGEGEQLGVLRTLVAELGLQDRVFLKAMLPYNQITQVIENADLGVVPKRGNSFGNEAFSTKILEFMAMGVPVIVPETAIDRYYFNDSVAKFFKANDDKSLADAMLLLITNPEMCRELARNADEFMKKYTWEENKGSYLNLVDSLVQSPNGAFSHSK